MSESADWVREFARQADADFRTWESLQPQETVPHCHKLQFLQMACEKLCKAHLILAGTPAESVQSSHAYVARPLPAIIRQHIAYLRIEPKKMHHVVRALPHLSQEIELLSPSVDRGGRRPDNCEYPWSDEHDRVYSPLNWTFYPSRLLTAPAGRTFLKLVHGAIARLLQSQ